MTSTLLLSMKLSFQIEPRTLHFKFPATTSRGVYTRRKIWLVHACDRDNAAFQGTGECAPLFDLSPDYTADYPLRLRAVCDSIERAGRLDDEALRTLPSMRFGIETALLHAVAAANEKNTPYNTSFSRGEQGLPINGLVWMGDKAAMFEGLDDKLRQGFRCIKIKIGAIGFEDEIELLNHVRSEYDAETIQLRVDANGAFSPADVMERLDRLAAFGIQSIEQPLRAGRWDAMARVCRESPVPVALDEELIGLYSRAEKEAMLDKVRPAYLVLKPTLHGGLAGCEEWVSLAEERGIGWWVTSALESNVGLAAIACWTAHLLESHTRTNISDASQIIPQGLGTGQLFTDNIPFSQLQIRGGALWYDLSQAVTQE